jgi:hypothetical protein
MSVAHLSWLLPSGGKLAYPLRGTTTPVIKLGESDGFGTSWDLKVIPLNNKGVSAESYHGPLRAADGMFNGWYLDWSESETEVVFNGKTLHARRLILVENPKKPRLFTKYSVSP